MLIVRKNAAGRPFRLFRLPPPVGSQSPGARGNTHRAPRTAPFLQRRAGAGVIDLILIHIFARAMKRCYGWRHWERRSPGRRPKSTRVAPLFF